MFTVKITTDNAAFHDHDEDEHDREIAAKLDNGHDSGTILDANGNKVGSWSL